MGEVYLAEDTRLERSVALKILPAAFAQDAERMRRFVQEAKAASALIHPNIITIYEIGEIDDTHFIATEFTDDETLREHQKGELPSFKSALDIAIQIVSALQAAHGAGIMESEKKWFFRTFDTAGEFNLANFFPALPSQTMVAVFLLSALHVAN